MPVFYALNGAVKDSNSSYMIAALLVILAVEVVGVVWVAVSLWRDK